MFWKIAIFILFVLALGLSFHGDTKDFWWVNDGATLAQVTNDIESLILLSTAFILAFLDDWRDEWKKAQKNL